MKNTITIAIFTLCLTAFYNYVGQLVPQKEVYPPPNAEIRSGMSTDEMVEAGKIIVEGKGTCMNCHNGSQRFPVFDGVGARAKTRREGLSDVEYLAEALYRPNDYIVEPFAAGMPQVNKPPIGLDDSEILCVIAYLQSLGGKPSVTLETKLKYQGESTPAAAPAPAAGGSEEFVAATFTEKYSCTVCHSFADSTRKLGPSLFDVGKRLNKTQIYEALMEPDATVAAGFPPGVMGGTLSGNGFYSGVSTKDLRALVEYLSSLQGG